MIDFTEFKRPNGQRHVQGIERSPEIEETYKKLRAKGWFFSMEMLMTGVVVLYAERGSDPEDPNWLQVSAIEPNGPGIPVAVDKLIKDAAVKESL